MPLSDAAVDWPTLDELKQLRDITGSEWDGEADITRFTANLEAAIEYVKADRGDWDELTDVPNVKLARAAMRMAVLMRDNASVDMTLLARDPVYQAYMRGERERFAIA